MSDILKSVTTVYPTRPKVAILMSGSGTNAETLLMNEEVRDLYNVSLIFTDNRQSNAAKIAASHNIPFVERHQANFSSRQERVAYFDHVLKLMGRSGIQGAIYAGFMKIVSRDFSEKLPGVNVHPADLTITEPATGIAKYRGMQALSHMRQDLGYVASTLHVVDTPVDSGTAIAVSSRVACEPQWTDLTCHEQLKAHEHRLYPAGLVLLAHGITVDNLPISINTGE